MLVLGVLMRGVFVPVMFDMKSVGHFCYKPPVSSAYKSIVRCTKNLIIANSRVNASTIKWREKAVQVLAFWHRYECFT